MGGGGGGVLRRGKRLGALTALCAALIKIPLGPFFYLPKYHFSSPPAEGGAGLGNMQAGRRIGISGALWPGPAAGLRARAVVEGVLVSPFLLLFPFLSLFPDLPKANHRPSQVKSSQGLLFSEAKKPHAEVSGHGPGGWCAWATWSPPPPSLSREPGER